MKALLFAPLWLLISLNDGFWQPRSDQARVIIYRQREFGGNAYAIKINDREKTQLPTNRYIQVDVLPGRVKLESVKDYFSDNQILWLIAQPGQTYYVKAVEEIDFLSRTLLLAPINEEQAQRELRKVKRIESPLSN
ncbi:hypothetical protein ACFSUS_06400 [Spirosoma soli]|uniref:DUF2846 domain-containing protein n=1 Tax=Spirosoma soli TaxID=1770529 RepID=A0ABW5LZP6_9BACT